MFILYFKHEKRVPMDDKNILNNNDSMDINELASLNEDISPELIDQLQAKISNQLNTFNQTSNSADKFDANNDATLFEEPNSANNTTESGSQNSTDKNKNIDISKNFDDNFVKKYKAKLNKQLAESNKDDDSDATNVLDKFDINTTEEETVKPIENIEILSKGNIKEKELTQDLKQYNDSLDLLDNNVKYSKYVIYIDPKNVPFIESLTVKERKNLINSLLSQQDNIAVTKHKFKVAQAMFLQILVAVIVFIISVPIVYSTINTSLEATINNYRKSQSNFQTLYREKGKITQINK